LKFRTDLAIERKAMLDEENRGKTDHDGVIVEKYSFDEDISCTKIRILNEEGEKKLGKPAGTYVTLEVSGILDDIPQIKERAGHALAEELKKLIHFHYYLKVLVIGIGNKDVTPDALGPHAANKVRVTRHLFNMFGADGDEECGCVSCVVPGVTGMTGIETAELIKNAVELTKPEVVIIIDSLAARSIERVSTTIQINDTGIEPGSGMGNMRKSLNEEYLGCRVVAIGVPTVIDAATIIREALEAHMEDALQIDEYVEKHHQELIVTSTDIDQLIKDFSDIISNGINKTVHPGIYS
jgi:spore protease